MLVSLIILSNYLIILFKSRMLGGNNNNGLLDSINPFGSSDTEDGLNFGKYFELTYKQRILGFGILAITGILFSMIGTFLLFSLNLVGFAIMYTFGNISMVFATLFLFGPIKQIKSMFSSTHRAIAVITYFLLIIVTLVVAFTIKSAGICIFLVVLESVAYIWYTITSIPGGQTICESCCKNIVSI